MTLEGGAGRRGGALGLGVVFAGALGLVLGCGGAARGRSASTDAVVVITCNVREAALFVDGRFIAPVGLVAGGVAVAPGHHRVELRHQEYLGRFLELDLAPAERRVISTEMFPILP